MIKQVREVVHATTVATNAILELNTARMGLITTAGFRDVLEIGRHFRRDIYNLFLEKPPPLIPRHRRLEVNERIDADGNVICKLDCDQVSTESTNGSVQRQCMAR
jgi:N-methylhydantoinase A/oxoprolinase/acetone carboxylase beta subunit